MGERADYVSTSNVRASTGSGGTSGSTDDADPEVIAADIEATREEMSSTIDAIQERLDPERLTQQATEVTEHAKEAATEITEQAREAAKDVAKYAIEEAKAAVNELTSQAKTTVREATIGRVEHMAMYTRDTAESVKGDLFTTIKRNPVPAALAAISIGWLWSHRSGGGSQSSSYARYGNYRGETHSDWNYQSASAGSPYYGSYGTEGNYGSSGSIGGYGSSGTHGGQYDQQGGQGQQMGGQIVGQAQERVGQVQEKAGQVAGQAGQVVGQAGQVVGQVPHQMRERAGQMQQQAQGFWHMLETNPVAVGALGTVLGGVAGLLIPETEKENQLMGETRDRVVGSVQEMAGETVAKAQIVAQEAGKSAMEAGQAAIEEVNSQQGSTGQSGSSQSGSSQSGSGKSGSGSAASSSM
ncbi:MAG: hypothetical protein K0R44_3195 [Thermomicrobiales bacterium]|nr:hypothetical protein [Thermomicrobiales bacterium]